MLLSSASSCSTTNCSIRAEQGLRGCDNLARPRSGWDQLGHGLPLPMSGPDDATGRGPPRRPVLMPVISRPCFQYTPRQGRSQVRLRSPTRPTDRPVPTAAAPRGDEDGHERRSVLDQRTLPSYSGGGGILARFLNSPLKCYKLGDESMSTSPGCRHREVVYGFQGRKLADYRRE